MLSDKQKKIIVIVIAILGIIGSIWFSEVNLAKKNKDREANAKYTIGITNGRDWLYKSSAIHIMYKYKIYGMEYEELETLKKTQTKKVRRIGGIYIVQFSKVNKENSKMLFDLGEVPDSIVEDFNKYSIGVWDTIPKW